MSDSAQKRYKNISENAPVSINNISTENKNSVKLRIEEA